MTLIDDSTGLPALPKGQYWQVLENSPYSGFYFVPPIKTGPVLRLMEKRRITIEQTRKVLFFFNRQYKKEVEQEYCVEEETITDGEKSIRLDGLTPELIRITADKILTHQAQIARGMALLGDYPPKKLEN